MIITIDGKLKILNGGTQFNDAFRGKNKKARFRAHRRLNEELRKRGYYSGGIKPFGFEEEPLPDPKVIGCAADLKEATTGIVNLLHNIKRATEQLKEGFKSYDFYENPDLGQRIPDDILLGSTKLFTIDEIMECVPNEPATRNPESD